MSVIERIQKIEASKPYVPIVLLPGVLATVSESHLDTILGDLSKAYPIVVDRNIIEGGKKLVVDIKWPSDASLTQNRMVLSVREGRLAFMGNITNNQYLVLERNDIGNVDLVEECIVSTFTNHQLVTCTNV